MSRRAEPSIAQQAMHVPGMFLGILTPEQSSNSSSCSIGDDLLGSYC